MHETELAMKFVESRLIADPDVAARHRSRLALAARDRRQRFRLRIPPACQAKKQYVAPHGQSVRGATSGGLTWIKAQPRLQGASPHAAPCLRLCPRQKGPRNAGAASPISATRASSTRCATPSCRRIGSKTSGDKRTVQRILKRLADDRTAAE